MGRQYDDSGAVGDTGGVGLGSVLRDANNAGSFYSVRIEELDVPIATVSSKFQLVIPREIREAVGIEPRQKLGVLQYQNRIELIPMPSMLAMKGFLKGINTTVHRDEERT